MLSKRSQGIELSALVRAQVVVTVLVRETTHMTFASAAITVVVRDIGFVALFFLLSRNGESREIGWTFKKGPRSIVFATLTFPLILYGISFAQILWLRLGYPARAAPSYFVMIVRPNCLCLAISGHQWNCGRDHFSRVSNTEIHRVDRPFLGGCWSSALFGLGHVYQGTANALSIGCLGLVFAVICLQEWPQPRHPHHLALSPGLRGNLLASSHR